MSSRLTRLKQSAKVSCYNRKHIMTYFKNCDYGVWRAHCVLCGMETVVKEYPAPNEIDIGGEAVALDCNPEVLS